MSCRFLSNSESQSPTLLIQIFIFIFYFYFCAYPMLLFGKPRERVFADGSTVAEGLLARQGPTRERGSLRTRLAPRSLDTATRSASTSRALPPWICGKFYDEITVHQTSWCFNC